MSIPVADLLFGALAEIRVARAGDVLEPEAQALALSVLNEYLDELNAAGEGLYSTQFETFTITANHQPHTIGIAANAPDWTVTIARPVEMRRANLILTNSIRKPLEMWDEERWNAERAFAITSAVPLGCWYSPDWPNGSATLWPIPTTAYGFECWIATLLASLAATDTFDLPMGYQSAVRLTLAERLAPSFGQRISPDTKSAAMDARAAAFTTNSRPPNVRTRDAGMPGGSGRGGGFDYRTGMIRR